MVSTKARSLQKSEGPRNSAVVLDLKDKESVINSDTPVGQKSPGAGESSVLRRRRKEIPKSKTPNGSKGDTQGASGFKAVAGPSRYVQGGPRRSQRPRRELVTRALTSSSDSSVSEVSSGGPSMSSESSESDSTKLQVKKKVKKADQGGKKRGRKPAKPAKSKGQGRKKGGGAMTEYDRMIQKNIEERNALLKDMMKGEGDSFEEEKPVESTSSKPKRRESSTNDEEETEVAPSPPKRKKITARRKNVSVHDSDDEEPSGYNTRNRGAGRTRGIYREHESTDEAFSEAADISDDESDDETGSTRKMRSYANTRAAERVTRNMAILVQRSKELKAKQSALAKGAEVQKDDDPVLENHSTEADPGKESSGAKTTEVVGKNDKILLTPKRDEKTGAKEKDKGIDESSNQVTPFNTPLRRKENFGVEREIVAKTRRLSDQFLEEDKENSLRGDKKQGNGTDAVGLGE